MKDGFHKFFGSGYKKKETLTEKKFDDLSDCNVAVNIMGDLYKGETEIKMCCGDVIVDGIKEGKLPITSGTWVKILKGKKFGNSILTNIETCDTMEGVDK